eukprot:m.51646 g.51646  ORF g.51646 m.51646 type:complete len:481 (+) comp7573_c0_seq4:45-1487(+)
MLRLHGNIRQRFPQWLSNPFLAFSTVSSGIDERARVVVLAGATAIGKTELSLQLAERINGEIISADSVQVYKGMDIGTDKVSKEERKRVPHHLLDVTDFYSPYSSGDFVNEAMAKCEEIISRGKTPIIAGGTWFYLNTLRNGLPASPRSNPVLESKIQHRYSKFEDDVVAWEHAIEDLRQVDPVSAASIQTNDWYRLTRSMSVFELTEKPFSSFIHLRKPGLDELYKVTSLYLTAPRWLLFDRINQRCEQIVDRGLVEETLSLLEEGLDPGFSAARAIGYKQSIEFIGKFWLKKTRKSTTMKRKGFYAFLSHYQAVTRQLCASQMRSFRKDPSISWIIRGEGIPLEDTLEEMLEVIETGRRPKSLEAWDKDVVRQNTDLLQTHNTPLVVFEEPNVIEEKMDEIETAVYRTGLKLGWNVAHLDPVGVQQHDDSMDDDGGNGISFETKNTRGERRKQRFINEVLPTMPKKKQRKILKKMELE